jgi:sterol 3beta-glucosyltransferase
MPGACWACRNESTGIGDVVKIALFVHGTRGDVQPFTILALELMERGHEVTLAAPPNLTDFVRKCGVRAEKIAVDSQAFMESEEGRKWLASGNVSAFMKRMSAAIGEHRDELIEDYQRASAGADLIVAGLLCEDFASVVADRQGVPIAAVHFTPLRPTGDFPAPLVTTKLLPLRALNRATHALFDRVWWNGQREHTNVRVSSKSRPTAGEPIDGPSHGADGVVHHPCFQPTARAAAAGMGPVPAGRRRDPLPDGSAQSLGRNGS